MLPGGCASILGLGVLVAYGLCGLDVSVGHMLCVRCAVLHMLCVVVLYFVLMGVHDVLGLWPEYAFGRRPHFADVFMVNVLYVCPQCTVIGHQPTVSLRSVWICL